MSYNSRYNRHYTEDCRWLSEYIRNSGQGINGKRGGKDILQILTDLAKLSYLQKVVPFLRPAASPSDAYTIAVLQCVTVWEYAHTK